MRSIARLALVLVAIATGRVADAHAGQASGAYLDLPITQTINRNGALRYAVWVKVGERSVEALIDTGSTGLRVLPPVYPGDIRGRPTDAAFGAGLDMAGQVVLAPVEIGSMTGRVPVEVVDHVACLADRPSCEVSRLGSESYLIGGDGFPSQGYSAILGIGFPHHGSDLPNPLTFLGAKRWIVDLPRPYAMAPGHLILDPDTSTLGGFTMLARHGIADADGCIRGGTLTDAKCGTVLFDTGAPAIHVSFEGVWTTSVWDEGTAGDLSFTADGQTLDLDFKAGQNGGLMEVAVTPPNLSDPPGAFILAGVDPYFTYDILYDEPAHAVGLRRRRLPSLVDEGVPESTGSVRPMQHGNAH